MGLLNAEEAAAAMAALQESETDQPEGDDSGSEGESVQPQAGQPEEDAPQAAPSPGTQTSAEESPASDQPRYKVKVDGEEVEVTLDELQQGYMRNGHFTQKSQALAEQRKQLEPIIKFAELVERDPQLQQRLKPLVFEAQHGQPYSPETEERVMLERDKRRVGITGALMSFNEQHPDLTDEDMYAVGEVMASGKVPSPEVALRLLKDAEREQELERLRAEVQQVKQRERQRYEQQKAAAGVPVMGGGGAPATLAPKPIKTFEEAHKAALAHFNAAQ